MREVKADTTLRSGKEVDHPTYKLKHDEETVAEKEKREENKGNRKGKSTMKDEGSVVRIVIKEFLLPLLNEVEIQRSAKEDPPKLTLKPLSLELKYAYLVKIS